MPNILINPNSGIMEFSTGVAGGSSFIPTLNFTGGSSYSARLTHDNFGGLNIVSYTTGSGIAYSGIERFSIDGNNGRLFSVTDNLSGSLFSVNDIAGLPIIEAFDDNTVVMGAFNRNDFVLTGNSLGLGGLPNTGTTKLYVSGNVTVSGDLNVTGSVNINGISVNPYQPEFPAWTGIRRYSQLALESLTTAAPFSGYITYFPFLIKKNITNPVACVEMTSYSTNDPKINIGIYSGHYGFENARLIASGSITGSINYTGIYRTTLNGNFSQGPYIVASVLQTGQGSTFRIVGSHGIREHIGLNTGNLILHGVNSTFESNTIYETGSPNNDLKTNIGTGIWNSNSTSLGPVVFLEY
jgi:hypothetical protein